jgi:hypothetical protein
MSKRIQSVENQLQTALNQLERQSAQVIYLEKAVENMQETSSLPSPIPSTLNIIAGAQQQELGRRLSGVEHICSNLSTSMTSQNEYQVRRPQFFSFSQFVGVYTDQLHQTGPTADATRARLPCARNAGLPWSLYRAGSSI